MEHRRRRRARMYLQMAICYKTWFGFLFYPVSLLLLLEKLARFAFSSALARVLPVAAFVLLLLADATRYWLGTHGNLRRQVFHLTAFLFLSLCPLVPCVLFCAFGAEHRIAFDVVAGALFLALLAFEVIAALVVLRGLLRHETSRFVRLREAAREKRKQDAMLSSETAAATSSLLSPKRHARAPTTLLTSPVHSQHELQRHRRASITGHDAHGSAPSSTVAC